MNDRRIPIANVYYLLCYAWDHVEERDVVRVDALDQLDGVHNLLGKVLAAGTFHLLRTGIDQGYREVCEDVAGVRGKAVVGETVKRALRARGRVACEFEELSRDVPHNRVLRATLGSLLRLPDLATTVRADVRQAYLKLDGVSTVPLHRKLFRQVQLDRNRRYYRFLLSICRMIHEQLLVDERLGAARFAAFSVERMDSLYENFIINFYRREQNRYRVNHGGRAIRWVDEGTPEHERRRIPRMEADVVLEADDRRVIMDAKFYSKEVGGTVPSSNLYQLLAYLRNREATVAPGPKHEGMLLYPTVGAPVRADVRLEGFVVQARSIDLAKDWRDIHRDMLELVA